MDGENRETLCYGVGASIGGLSGIFDDGNGIYGQCQ